MLPDFNVRTQKKTITQGKYDRNILKSQPDPFHVAQTFKQTGGVGSLLALVQFSTNNPIPNTGYYFYDGNGNVMNLLGDSDQTLATYEYDPFGRKLLSTGTLASQPFQFSTKEFSEVTGLNYYGYRFYNAQTGRWMSRDPIAEWGGLNLMAFSGNDLVNRTDPLGLLVAETTAVAATTFTTTSGAGAGVTITYAGTSAGVTTLGTTSSAAVLTTSGTAGVGTVAGTGTAATVGTVTVGTVATATVAITGSAAVGYGAGTLLGETTVSMGGYTLNQNVQYLYALAFAVMEKNRVKGDTKPCERNCIDDANRRCPCNQLKIINTAYQPYLSAAENNGSRQVGHASLVGPGFVRGFWPAGAGSGRSPVDGVVMDDSLTGTGAITKMKPGRSYRVCPETLLILIASFGNDKKYQFLNIGAPNCAGWVCRRLQDAGLKPPANPNTPNMTPQMVQ